MKQTSLEKCARLRIEIVPTAFQTQTLTLNVTFNSMRAMVITHTRSKGQGHSVQDVRVATDRRTEATALAPVLTWSVITVQCFILTHTTSLSCHRRPARCAASHPLCCTQRWTFNVTCCQYSSVKESWQHLRRSIYRCKISAIARFR